MNSAHHPWLRVAVLATVAALAVAVVAALGAGLAAADTHTDDAGSEPVNETTIGDEYGDQLEGQLADVDVLHVDFSDAPLVRIYIETHTDDAAIAVTDAGAVDLGSDQRRSVPFEVYRPESEGVHELRMYLDSDDELITIQQGEEMMAASGDRQLIDIIQSAPTPALIRWAAVSGTLGATLALALVVGSIRRQHQNTYKELLSEERVRIEEDPVEGALGVVQRWISHNRYALLAAAAITAYLLAIRTGYAPTPVAAWADMSDAQRVVTAGTVSMCVVALPFEYILAVRLWEPRKEYVIDVDARDVLDPSLGSNGGLALDAETPEDVADELSDRDDMDVVAIYSGAPERVSDMRVDGAPAEARTPGGTGHIVQDFNAKRNSAVGCWPGTASDVELIADRSKIDGNREILRDESRMLRTLIGAMPAIATASDTDAMRAVDRELRQLVNVDSGPIDGLLNRAADGTRFEGVYGDDDAGDDDDKEDEETGLESLIDPRSDDDDDDDKEDR